MSVVDKYKNCLPGIQFIVSVIVNHQAQYIVCESHRSGIAFLKHFINFMIFIQLLLSHKDRKTFPCYFVVLLKVVISILLSPNMEYIQIYENYTLKQLLFFKVHSTIQQNISKKHIMGLLVILIFQNFVISVLKLNSRLNRSNKKGNPPSSPN